MIDALFGLEASPFLQDVMTDTQDTILGVDTILVIEEIHGIVTNMVTEASIGPLQGNNTQ
jgi:hypothetical protein